MTQLPLVLGLVMVPFHCACIALECLTQGTMHLLASKGDGASCTHIGHGCSNVGTGAIASIYS